MRLMLRAFAWIVLAVSLPGGVASASAQSGPSMIVLVRHAEVDTGPRGDPVLSEAGRERAQALAATLQDAGVAAIVTSTFRRTRETAQPLARALGVTPVAIGIGRDLDDHLAMLAAAIRAVGGGTVLVVGHGETVPGLIGRLGGPHMRDLCETTFDRLFVLVPAGGRMLLTRARYGQASTESNPDCP